MKTKLIPFFIGFPLLFFSQMLITKTADVTDGNPLPHPSAMLELRSKNQGVAMPIVALQSTTDKITVKDPQEGTIVLNSTTNSTNPGQIPTVKPALALWDGTKWLFAYSKESVALELDRVRNFIADNGSTTVSFSTFPTSSPSVSYGSGTTGWQILIDTDNNPASEQPSFEFNSGVAEQRMVIDVEGMAAINNSNSASLAYMVGLFVDNKLISATKIYNNAVGAANCTFNKFNIRGILIESTPTILVKNAGVKYNVKLGVRVLPKPSNTYTNLTFGDSASNCDNLNTGTTKSYMNILTIERKNITN